MKKVVIFTASILILSGLVIAYSSLNSQADSGATLIIDFDSGGGVQIESSGENYWELRLEDDVGDDQRDYFHLKFEDTKDETIDIDFTGMGRIPADQPLLVNYGTLSDPDWEYAETTVGDFEYSPEQDEVYVASYFPYPNERIYTDQVQYYSENYETVDYEIIGQSKEDRDMYAMTIEDPDHTDPKEIVLYARQHSQETYGSFRLDGILDFVAPRVEHNGFEENYSFHILPNLNPDGIYNGIYREDPEGNDLNREWDETADTPVEIENAKDYIRDNIENPHFGLDLHSSTNQNYESVVHNPDHHTEDHHQDWVEAIAENVFCLDGIRDTSDDENRARGFFYSETGGTMVSPEQYQYYEHDSSDDIRDVGTENIKEITEYDEDFEESEDTEDDNGIWVPDDSEGVKDWIWNNLSLVVGTALIVGIAVMIDRELNG